MVYFLKSKLGNASSEIGTYLNCLVFKILTECRLSHGLLLFSEYGDRTPFFHNLVQGTMSSSLMGAFYGGYKTSQVAYLDFMRTNQATAFLTHMDAKVCFLFY